MKLNELRDNEGARKERMRVGRGIGSGKGVRGGRGQKGQKSRSGVSINGFEGGQMPLYRRLPKRGFNNSKFANVYTIINLGTLQAAVDAGRLDASKTVDAQALIDAGLIKKAQDGIRLLGKGTLKAALTVEVAGVTKTAQEAVEKAGGKVVLKPVAPKGPADKAAKKAE